MNAFKNISAQPNLFQQPQQQTKLECRNGLSCSLHKRFIKNPKTSELSVTDHEHKFMHNGNVVNRTSQNNSFLSGIPPQTTPFQPQTTTNKFAVKPQIEQNRTNNVSSFWSQTQAQPKPGAQAQGFQNGLQSASEGPLNTNNFAASNNQFPKSFASVAPQFTQPFPSQFQTAQTPANNLFTPFETKQSDRKADNSFAVPVAPSTQTNMWLQSHGHQKKIPTTSKTVETPLTTSNFMAPNNQFPKSFASVAPQFTQPFPSQFQTAQTPANNLFTPFETKQSDRKADNSFAVPVAPSTQTNIRQSQNNFAMTNNTIQTPFKATDFMINQFQSDNTQLLDNTFNQVQESIASNRVETPATLYNRVGCPVFLGRDAFANIYYCRCVRKYCPDCPEVNSDGSFYRTCCHSMSSRRICGPYDGPQCNNCMGLNTLTSTTTPATIDLSLQIISKQPVEMHSSMVTTEEQDYTGANQSDAKDASAEESETYSGYSRSSLDYTQRTSYVTYSHRANGNYRNHSSNHTAQTYNDSRKVLTNRNTKNSSSVSNKNNTSRLPIRVL